MLPRFACLVVGVLLFAGVPLRAQDPVSQAQAIISRQITAFLADDEASAYAQAAPNMRNGITDKATFLRMIRERYQPVYRARRYAFGRSKLIGGGELILQEVLITDRAGNDWTALFEMRLMDDGIYRVNGVRLSRNVASQGI